MNILSLLKKKTRIAIPASLYSLLMIMVLCLICACPGNAAEGGPEGQDDYTVSYKLTKEDLEDLESWNRDLENVKKKEDNQAIIDVNYKTKRSLEKDLHSAVEELTDSEMRMITAMAKKGETYQLEKRDSEDLKSWIGVKEDIMDKLQEFKDIEYATKNLFERALTYAAPEFSKQKALNPIVKNAKKEHKLSDYKDKEIKWTAESCGCVLEDLSGVVYGFYPFWMAAPEQKDEQPESKKEVQQKGDGEDKQAQIIDFRVMSRIGYYALTLDENGKVANPFSSDIKKKSRFIREARRYGTKVDLVIYVDDWPTWSTFPDRDKKTLIEKATTNIANFVDIELTDLFSVIKPYVSFGQSRAPTMWDGITLYFKSFIRDDQKKGDRNSFLIDFIKKLRSKLDATGKKYYLNIMLDMSVIKENDKGVKKELEYLQLFENIVPDVPGKGKDERTYEMKNYVNHFLVLLEEPTTKSKKDVRMAIENSLTGVQRRNMLRKIIPVITPYKHNEQQLEDDLIYFEDNFGGVGCWPLPMNKGPAGAEVKAALIAFYQTDEASPPSVIRGAVCRYRWAFRIVWDILFIFLLLYGGLSIWMCNLRELFVRFFWYFLAVILLWILLGLALLFFDPAWKKISEGNGPLIFLILGIIAFAVWRYVMSTRKGELP